ncbi:ArsC/Spx/MgsR family protein [Bacteriovorax sp. Seq25_V]|uniref:ArsC/Spx/MgsR family protein n=1 Tax=Bacteriovorax sp. Seq25_V TaxID=1201288 RepID=UPI000389F5EB|nr:ArsC/Spx/MgsR family protein [Bacteriovorax sp. Seq25_V]EQC46072.1 putative arsenate reductase [Bacteriovorax sp. Seq25_V]
MDNILYHNPRCSKSRTAIDLLNESGISYSIKEYLKESMSLQELESIFKKLKISSPLDGMIRLKEFPETDFNTLSNKEIFEFIITNPVLLERPIFVTENTAVIGRPTEVLARFLAK